MQQLVYLIEGTWHTLHKMHASSCWFSSVNDEQCGTPRSKLGSNELRQRTFQALQLSQVLRYFVGRELPAVLAGENMVS